MSTTTVLRSHGRLSSGLHCHTGRNRICTESVGSRANVAPLPADLEYQLLEAAKVGDLDDARSIFGANHSPQLVNCRDLDGLCHSTPLHFAASYNRLAVVEFLLQWS